MAKKQVFGLKAGRGLCPICGEQVQHVKFIKPFQDDTNKAYKFDESVIKACKCPGKSLADFKK